MFNYDNLKNQIKNLSPAELETRGVITAAKTRANGEQTFICPLCGNGSGNSGDGLAVRLLNFGYNYKCFSCGQSFDNLALFACYYGIDNHGAGYFEILKRAAADFGLSADFQDFYSCHNLKPIQIKAKIPAPVESDEDRAQKSRLIELLKKDIADARANLKDFVTKCGGKWRNLTFETLNFFECGYDEYWVNPYARLKNVRNATPTPRVIIPSGNHYLARLTVDLETYKNALDAEYIKDKPHFGSKSIFGIKTISAATEIVVVTEGEIDCMQLWQAYCQLDFNDNEKTVSKATLAKKAFIATGGAAETFWLAEVDQICKELNCCPLFVIMFDDDEAGHKNAPKCKAELNRLGYPAAVKYLQKKG